MNDFLTWARLQWDRLTAWIAIAAGGIALLLGWLGVSDTPYPAAQIPYVVSGGLLGMFLLGTGALLWLSADIRDTWRKLDQLVEHPGTVDASTDSASTQLAPTDVVTMEVAPAEVAPRRSRRKVTSRAES